MKADPVLIMDFGDYSIDISIGFKSTKEQMAYSYYFKKNANTFLHLYIHMKKDNTLFHIRDINNDITGFPEKVYIYISSYSYSINHLVLP